MTELMPWKSRTRPNSSTKWPESTWIEVRGGEAEEEVEEVVVVVEEIKAKTMQGKRRPNISQAVLFRKLKNPQLSLVAENAE